MYCIKCGAQIEEVARFCPFCGASQTLYYKMSFARNGMSESAFIASINQWLYNNPRIANVKCSFGKRYTVGLFANNYILRDFEIEYELFNSNNSNQYELTKVHHTDLARRSIDKCLESWKAAHPQCRVINWSGGTSSRGQAGSLLLGGIGAVNHLDLFIFYKFPCGSMPPQNQ